MNNNLRHRRNSNSPSPSRNLRSTATEDITETSNLRSTATEDILKKIEPMLERENRQCYDKGAQEGQCKGFVGGFVFACVMFVFAAKSLLICEK